MHDYPTIGLVPGAVAALMVFWAHWCGQNAKGLSVKDGGFWRITEGFSVVVWYVSGVIYSFAYMTHFGNTADHILPIPTWALQAFIGITGAGGGYMVARYLWFYVVELLPSEDAAMKAMLIVGDSDENGPRAEA